MSIFSHSELIDFACKYLRRTSVNKKSGYEHNPSCTRIFKELVTSAGETPDAIGYCGCMSYLIEAKTSLSDFYADQKKPWRRTLDSGMGNFKYYICEKGVIPINKIPEKWGLIEIENGKIIITKKAEHHNCDKNKEVILLLSWIRRIECGGDTGPLWKKYSDKQEVLK